MLSALTDHLLMAGFGIFCYFVFFSSCEKNWYNWLINWRKPDKLKKNFPFLSFMVDYYILSWNLRIWYLRFLCRLLRLTYTCPYLHFYQLNTVGNQELIAVCVLFYIFSVFLSSPFSSPNFLFSEFLSNIKLNRLRVCWVEWVEAELILSEEFYVDRTLH